MKKYNKIIEDLNDTKNYLFDAVSKLLERGETLDSCEEKSKELVINSEKFDSESNQVIYSNRVSKVVYEHVIPFFRNSWGFLKYYSTLVICQKPCQIYSSTPKKIYLKIENV